MVYMGIALLVANSKSFCRPVGGVEGGGELLHDKQSLGDANHYFAGQYHL